MRTIYKSNVVVCGGAGFIGSHLVDYLVDVKKCRVIVLDNLSAGFRKFIHPKADFFYCDITHSEEHLLNIFKELKIDYVFNYVAEPYIPVSFARPLHVFDVNARGALMVINAAHLAGVKGILQISSAEIYGDVAGKIKETDPACPRSSYGVSKLAIDGLVQSRWKEASTPAIILRQFNCYGNRETHPYVIPEIINQLSKRSIIKLGNNSFRDFQYVGDAVRMAVELLEKGKLGEVYNMGSETGIKIYDLARLIARLMCIKNVKIIFDKKRERPHEIWHLQSDNTKLYKTICARPVVEFEYGLANLIQYYKKNNNKFDYEI